MVNIDVVGTGQTDRTTHSSVKASCQAISGCTLLWLLLVRP
uniref:Uncharacterized protein n=1 Tax=Anguilla anguilla TaxID=7936 RepID=A0A0E9Q618_ANGAN